MSEYPVWWCILISSYHTCFCLQISFLLLKPPAIQKLTQNGKLFLVLFYTRILQINCSIFCHLPYEECFSLFGSWIKSKRKSINFHFVNDWDGVKLMVAMETKYVLHTTAVILVNLYCFNYLWCLFFCLEILRLLLFFP